MTQVQLYYWKYGTALACVVLLCAVVGCAAPFESFSLRPGKKDIDPLPVAVERPSPVEGRLETKTAAAPESAEAISPAQYGPGSKSAVPSSTVRASEVATSSIASPGAAELEQMVARTGPNLSPEHQQYLREQLLAILAAREPATPTTATAADLRANTASAPASPVILPGPQPDVPQMVAVEKPPPAPRPSPPRTEQAAADVTSPTIRPTVQVAAHAEVAGHPSTEPAASQQTSQSSETSASPSTPAVEKIEDIQAGQWRSTLARALEELEKELARFPHDDRETATLGTYLRLLNAIANHPQEATKAIDKLPEDEQEYWKHQLHALVLALDAENKHVSSRRAALVLRELRSAVDSLSDLSTLDVRNLAFCEAVESFGRYTEFRSQSFRPGAEVLLYVEIENFTAEPVGDKFETELQATYDVYDSQGVRVANVMLPLDKQLCDNRRRDYFIAYHLFLPKDLGAGAYSLRLTIEDLKGHKSSQGSIEFRIR